MKDKKPEGIGKPTMVNVGIMEISCGILALSAFLGILTHGRWIQADPAMAWRLFPAACACSLYLVLGFIVLFRTQASRVLHFIFIPLISAVIFVTPIFFPVLSLGAYLLLGIYLVVGAISIFYAMV